MELSFRSKRLYFSPLDQKDVPAVFALHSFPEVAKYNTIGIPKNEAESACVLAHKLNPKDTNNLGWAVYDGSDQFIGEIGLIFAPERFHKAENSYSIVPKHWNNGYATEAVFSLIQWGFAQGLHRIEAGVAVHNKLSIRVLEKVGMRREGHHRKILPLQSGWSDNYSYAILKEEFS